MPLSKAIILAAGVGSRLRPLTNGVPKCLLDVGGQTILDRQIDALAEAGVGDVVIVVGYLESRIRAHLGSRARYIVNNRYEETNSLYSMWLAREELADGALILNSDVVVPRRVLGRLVEAPAADAVLVEFGSHFEPEDMKVTVDDGRVVDFGTHLPPARAHAHNVGVAKFSPEGAELLTACLEMLVHFGHENDWLPLAFREFAQHWPLLPVPTDGLPWIEVDFPADLERARTEIAPVLAELDARGLAVPGGEPVADAV